MSVVVVLFYSISGPVQSPLGDSCSCMGHIHKTIVKLIILNHNFMEEQSMFSVATTDYIFSS